MRMGDGLWLLRQVEIEILMKYLGNNGGSNFIIRQRLHFGSNQVMEPKCHWPWVLLLILFETTGYISKWPNVCVLLESCNICPALVLAPLENHKYGSLSVPHTAIWCIEVHAALQNVAVRYIQASKIQWDTWWSTLRWDTVQWDTILCTAVRYVVPESGITSRCPHALERRHVQ